MTNQNYHPPVIPVCTMDTSLFNWPIALWLQCRITWQPINFAQEIRKLPTWVLMGILRSSFQKRYMALWYINCETIITCIHAYTYYIYFKIGGIWSEMQKCFIFENRILRWVLTDSRPSAAKYLVLNFGEGSELYQPKRLQAYFLL